jgi:hypothetical protein
VLANFDACLLSEWCAKQIELSCEPLRACVQQAFGNLRDLPLVFEFSLPDATSYKLRDIAAFAKPHPFRL